MCHWSPVTSQIFFLIQNIIEQSGGISQWRVCYQQGLSRLVNLDFQKNAIVFNFHQLGF